MDVMLNSLDKTFRIIHFEQIKHSYIFVKVQNVIEIYETLNVNIVKVISFHYFTLKIENLF